MDLLPADDAGRRLIQKGSAYGFLARCSGAKALAAPLCERAKAVILTGAAAPLIASALDGEISTRKAEGKTVPPIIYESDFDKLMNDMEKDDAIH